MKDKEFENLNLAQLKKMVEILLAIPAKRNEMLLAARDDSKGKLANSPSNFSWASFYSISIIELTVIFFKLAGLQDVLNKALATSDPQQYILDKLPCADEQIAVDESDLHSEYALVACIVALGNSLRSLEIYGRSLNYLHAQFVAGSDEALFKIIRIDHSAISNPEIARRIAIAEMKSDEDFFKQLSNALLNRPKKPMKRYGPLRYILATLDEMGYLDSLGERDLYNLLSLELDLYPRTGDPRSLKRFVDRWKSDDATRNRDFMSSPS
ncbi:hypothetical protein [Porticoccus hydrocarbonoclasticus]|uniref:hypothetical protein n=1 Tax=Porticoccus hydrocarbonoclasticus TaxID=1073414 RepID=UPI0005688948|nr:hypothetical protein [Porticoccus hydrocarbonoclasticus]